nr:hypothetical transcript [Hymenolepis microstoma]
MLHCLNFRTSDQATCFQTSRGRIFRTEVAFANVIQVETCSYFFIFQQVHMVRLITVTSKLCFQMCAIIQNVFMKILRLRLMQRSMMCRIYVVD